MPQSHFILLFSSLLCVKETLRVSHLLPFRDLAASQTRVQGLDVHRRQSSRRHGLISRFNVVGVQAVRGSEPDPAISHDG